MKSAYHQIYTNKLAAHRTCRFALCVEFALMWLTFSSIGAEIELIRYPTSKQIQRADIYYIPSKEDVRAVLVLCPGDNGNGKLLLERREWRDYARTNHLGLLGVSFASDPADLHDNRGYYRVETGPGSFVIEAAKQAYGSDKGLLLYGFSGGAHFTSNFMNWQQGHVIAWCAYSAAWWDVPTKLGEHSPPGIVACGELDEVRKDESFAFFKKGRLNGQKVTWVCLKDTGHELSPTLEHFVRDYFIQVIYASPTQPGLWYDVDRLQPVDSDTVHRWPSLCVWLPSESLAQEWVHLQCSD